MSFNDKFTIAYRYLPKPSDRRSGIPAAEIRFRVAHDTGNPVLTASQSRHNLSIMRKTFLCLIYFLLITISANSQQIPSVIEKKISPVYSSDRLKKIELIQITVKGMADAVSLCSFRIDPVTLSNEPALVQPITATTAAESESATKTYTHIYQLELQTNSLKDTLKSVQVGQIFCIFPDHHEAKAVILTLSNDGIVDPHKYDANKPFWVEIGSNFDFADGLQANNFFGGAFFHKREIRSFSLRKTRNNDGFLVKRKTKYFDTDSKEIKRKDTVYRVLPSKNLSLFAGVYESKTISSLGTITQPRIYYDRDHAPVFPGDTLGIFTDTGTTKTIQVTKNISLFFSPQVRITNGSANEDGLHLFLSLWSEVQWQQASIESDYSSLVRRDTAIRVPRAKAVNYLPGNKTMTLDIKTHYLGIGFPLYYKEKDVNVYINPVLGWSTQPKSLEISDYLNRKDNSTIELPRVWRPFYVFQFRLNEEKYGFAFTGEVRGLVVKNSPPLISLALTKKFDLTKFIEFSK